MELNIPLPTLPRKGNFPNMFLIFSVKFWSRVNKSIFGQITTHILTIHMILGGMVISGGGIRMDGGDSAFAIVITIIQEREALLPGVEGRNFTVALWEAEDFQEGQRGLFQEEFGEAVWEDERILAILNHIEYPDLNVLPKIKKGSVRGGL